MTVAVIAMADMKVWDEFGLSVTLSALLLADSKYQNTALLCHSQTG